MRFIRKIACWLRKQRYKKIKIVNDDISIICNNCTAGIMYHDLGLPFLTPTVNLCFGQNKDFYYFCSHLSDYLLKGVLVRSTLKETRPGFEKSPIGLLRCDGLPEIEIHFMHYSSFEEAQKKWIDRSKRVNFKKIFILIEANNDYEVSLLEEYGKLPFPKMAFTYVDSELNYAKKMVFYDKHGHDYSHPILKFVNPFGRRGFDEIDFLEIFNYDFSGGSSI